MTVFVANKGPHDYSKAERYGKLCYLTHGHVRPFEIGSIYRQCMLELNYSKQNDYLLVTSLTIINVVAASILAKKHGRINLLMWNNFHRDYQEYTIVLDDAVLEAHKELDQQLGE